MRFAVVFAVLGVLSGCTPTAKKTDNAEATARVSQAATGTGGDAGVVVPTACVVAVKALQLGTNRPSWRISLAARSSLATIRRIPATCFRSAT